MTICKKLTLLTPMAAGLAVGGVIASTPAWAGGVGDFLSPAFGTSCANHATPPHPTGATTAGDGAAGGNLLGIPLSGALNQCGGADLAPDGPMELIGAATNKHENLKTGGDDTNVQPID